MDNWFSKVAKEGLLGSRAKAAGDAGTAVWSPDKSDTEKKREEIIKASINRIKDPQKG